MENDVIPYCLGNGVGTLAYNPLSGGFLAGRYERGKPPPAGSRATYRPFLVERINNETNFQKLDKIKEAAAKSGVTLPVFAIAWALRENRLTTADSGRLET